MQLLPDVLPRHARRHLRFGAFGGFLRNAAHVPPRRLHLCYVRFFHKACMAHIRRHLQEVVEILARERLRRTNPPLRVVRKHLLDKARRSAGRARHQPTHAASLNRRELLADRVVLGPTTNAMQYLWVWCAQHAVDALHLVQLVLARKEGVELEHLIEHAADPENVHFLPIHAV